MSASTVTGQRVRPEQADRHTDDTVRTELHRDYARVREAIDYLRESQREQPTLDDVADRMGLSPWHVQRIFTRWAGVSPKRFLQSLTLEAAKTRLRDGESVLDAAFDAGLSGYGRIHDLFVTLDAVTPGEYRGRGKGLRMRWGAGPTPFGLALVAWTDRGIHALCFLDATELIVPAAAALAEEWPRASLEEDPDGADRWLERVFPPAGDGALPERIPLLVEGTPFQLQVWRALLRIPDGAVVTYGEIARALGRPGSSRAVGGAVGRNPVAWLIPCHRVIRSTGAAGDYRWGAERKALMLARESARRADPRPGGPAD